MKLISLMIFLLVIITASENTFAAFCDGAVLDLQVDAREKAVAEIERIRDELIARHKMDSTKSIRRGLDRLFAEKDPSINELRAFVTRYYYSRLPWTHPIIAQAVYAVFDMPLSKPWVSLQFFSNMNPAVR